MKKFALPIIIMLLIGLTSCSPTDPKSFSTVSSDVVAYVSQPDSMVQDTILQTYQKDYVIRRKHVTEIYYKDYKTDMIFILVVSVVLGLVAGSVLTVMFKKKYK